MEQPTVSKKSVKTDLPTAQQQRFVGTILSLTMQLLVVVLLPFLGGHFLDEHYETTPLWTLLGLGLALALAALSTYRGYQTVTGKMK